jgi:hypothetical protein
MEVHVGSRLLYNCCKAYPERIALDWLKKNPGRLFHTDIMLNDRKLMLENKSCASCHHGCYKHEEQGLSSARRKQTKVFINNIESPLQHLQLVLSTDCNLTCAYCSPEWSTSWQRDIEKNGSYNLEGVDIRNSNWNKLWAKLKQKDRSTETLFFKLLLKEISLAKKLKSITILGGEPFLNNQLNEVISKVEDKRIDIITGLGVNKSRLLTFLKKQKGKNIRFKVSGETTGENFEFMRYGNNWTEFCEKVKMISDHGFVIEFISTMTNITLLDFHNFYNKFKKDYKININFVNGLPFLLPHVLDVKSKEMFKIWIEKQNDISIIQELRNSTEKDVQEVDRKNLLNYLTQFSNRRKISLNFLPQHFLRWCGVN